MLVSDTSSLTLTTVQLRNFSNAARQFGTTTGILSSAFNFREQLERLVKFFRGNATMLFPMNDAHRTSIDEHGCLSTLTVFLNNLAGCIEELLRHMEKFPEFKDDKMHENMTSLVLRLKVRSPAQRRWQSETLPDGHHSLGRGTWMDTGVTSPQTCSDTCATSRAQWARSLKARPSRSRILQKSACPRSEWTRSIATRTCRR
jgi:hypothetical protein